MIDFVEYIIGELSSKRLAKADALDLIRQFQAAPDQDAPQGAIGSLRLRNTSGFDQQSYETIFDGDEPFLRDHVVKGHRILPGVAYLEMVRQALADALPDAVDAVVDFRNVVWAQPIVADERISITIALFPAESHERDGAIDYEIYSVAENDDGTPAERIHSQGQIVLVRNAALAPQRDVAALRARMTRGRVDAERLYTAFDDMGMVYGPAQRAVRRLHLGEDEVLAHLVLPSVWNDAGCAYALHPSIMDGALQALLGFIDDIDTVPARPRLPYALDHLRIHAPCTGEMLAWLRSTPSQHGNGRVTRIDIDLCDVDGRVCVEWRGFSSRELGAAPAASTDAVAKSVLYAAPHWEDRGQRDDDHARPSSAIEHHALLCAEYASLADAIEGVQGHVLADDPESDPAIRYREVALACFAWLRQCFEARSTDSVLLQLVVADDDSGHLLLGLTGMLRSAALENPRLSAQIVAVASDATAGELNAWLQRAARLPQDTVQRFNRDGAHQAMVWREVACHDIIDSLPDDVPSAFRGDGVYVITGGLGGLGVLFARAILAQGPGTQVVLTGRAAPSAEIDQRLQALSLANDADTNRINYFQLDIDDAQNVHACFAAIAKTHGQIHGILHCAGCLRDDFILKKSVDDVLAVLAPKVTGTRHLDEATRDLDLDFLALFSGGASVTGNIGQSDYAAANGFMDRYAAHRNALVARGERRGVTRAVNWPFWREGGMTASADTLQRAEQIAGVRALDTAAGLQAFHRTLALPYDQIQVVQGDAVRLRQVLFAAPALQDVSVVRSVVVHDQTPHDAAEDAPITTEHLREAARAFIRRELSGLLKLPADQIETDAPLEKYGINSIMMMSLTNVLEDTFGSLPKTLFFEYQTLNELTEYFLGAHAEVLARSLGRAHAAAHRDASVSQESLPTTSLAPEAALSSSRAARRRQRFTAVEPSARDAAGRGEPVAIIGLSGRYPGARDLDAFWRNLRDGVDSIEEVPADRWDWRDYLSEDRTQPGHHYSKWGGFIEGVNEFDALFFNIPPVEAERIDPQERLFLEHAWMAMEDAGYTRARLQIPHGNDQPAQVGVYVGVMYGEYQMFGVEASLLGNRSVTPSSYASIANRVSYFLNLHGPSIALDTMCSSSLTAIHLACQDLREGRTDLAIAGGVNVTIHPNKYLMLSSGQFIATEGRCQSFGEGGDGYIPAEGVGALILKRLSEAEHDGDHIHGVILGSALNHGGKTNGYSVPNPQAQASVIAMAMQACGVDARRIGYLEAHGTGTKLGDPIEIAALTQAFRRQTADKGFCMIGSAKSNIGHAESAAGIAGLTKVLLQMKHGMVVPSLHATVLNPHIDFANTPFEVNRVLRPWAPIEVDGRPLPRLAGLSSFGAGGSNAHLIIEEYVPAASRSSRVAGPHAVVLSARTAEQLEQKVRDLMTFLRAPERDIALEDLAYTLQIGREAMEERLAFIVESIGALTAALQTWLDDPTTVVGCYRARANAGGGALALFNTDGELQATIDRWFETERLDRIADVWVNGVTINWNKAHAASPRPRQINLPTYPFARERCWIDRPGASLRVAGTVLHPLLHANVSDLRVQAYRSTFEGREFFLNDHRVHMGGDTAQRLMPGMAYLEMMRAAAVFAVPEWCEGGLELHDIAWSRPLVVTSPITVNVALALMDNDDIEMSVATASEGDAVVHCSGKVRPIQADALAPTRINLAQLRERLRLGTVAGDEVYARYARMGIEYGRSFRCVDHVRLGAEEVLAQLRLPPAATIQATGPADDFWLHPALMDGALQSALGLLLAAGRDVDRAPLPFALRAVRILAPCAPEMWAWIRYAPHDGPASTVVELDIDVCNAEGEVCVELRGLASRAAPREDVQIEAIVMAVPGWEPVAAPPTVSTVVAEVSSVLLACDLPCIVADAVAAVEDLRGLAFHVSAAVSISDPAERYAQHARRLLALLQDNSGMQTGARRWLQVVVPGDQASLHLLGLDAMLRTAAMENPAIRAQIVVVPVDTTAEALARHLRDANNLQHEPVVAFADGVTRVRRWQVLPDDIAGEGTHFEGMSSFRDDGVYLITGGMGGLGQLFAGYILAQTSHASVVLTGRRDLDAERQQQFDALAAGTGRLHYRVIDLADGNAVRDTVAEIVRSFGSLRGVLHSAGVSRDGLLPTRTASLLDEVLSPKVGGTQRLDAATSDLDLDFFVLFSSVSGALGNIGQADYAAANGFLDRFAEDRQRQVIAGVRRGKTVSINWPLWADGGMSLNAAAIDLLWRTAGVRPLSTDAGLRVFERSLLRTLAPQVLVLSGDPQRLRPLLLPRSAPERVPPVATPVIAPRTGAAEVVSAAAAEGSDHAQVETYLGEIFSRLLKVPVHRIDTRASLEQYGIDSVIAMTLTAEIEKEVGALPKTLLFEHQTIERLARYLLVTFPQRMRELVGPIQRETPVRAPILAPVAAPARSRIASASHRFRADAPRAERRVAIVGLAGRYPQAETLDRFWDNLRAGRDGITEVPGDRWDHARYFDPTRNQPGRTYSKWGGFLDNIGGFDARFFNVSPREAELIDPQERLFLETAWETIEDAGYSRERLAGKKIGVYVGVMWSHYELYGGDGAAGIPTSSHASIANRVSYFFDFHGPSIGLDTMCSSSLTAIHLAAEAVRSGVVEAAIAGGVNLSLHPQKYLNLSQGNFMSSDGRCRSFGAGGDGYVPGEGVGALLLKPLDDALRDGDHIYAILEASALNHGGKTHGYTVPNPVAQASLIGDTLKAAGIDPRSIGYIETHGTGTSLGDPIELAGLRQAFAEYTDETGFCAIGSVKSNIGHLEAAAGIAAVTKTLLQLRHGELVPSLHAEPPNPHIDFASSPFRVQTQLAPWPRRDGQPRRAAVSAFGAGGANAHVILAEYRQEATTQAPTDAVAVPGSELFLLSARDEAGLARYAVRIAEFLTRDEDATLRDIAYTSRIGRAVLPVRLAVLATSCAELRDKLSRWASSQTMATAAFVASGIEDCLVGRVVDAAAGGLIPGDAGQAFLGELLEREDWRALARLWIAGAEVNWAPRALVPPPKRVRIPTYPFAREHYWIDGHPPSIPPRSATVASTAPAPAHTPAATLLYRPEWTAQPLPAVAPASNFAANMAPVLVIGATPKWRQMLSDRLGGASVVLVTAGTAFEVRALDHIVVDPSREEDADRLVETLQAQGSMPRVVVQRHLGVTDIAADPSTIMGVLDIDAHFPASLAKALIVHRHSGETLFLSLICGVDASARVPGVALGGFHASLHRENPLFRCRIVELVAEASTAFDEIEIVAAELADSAWNSEVLRIVIDDGRALRERRQWVPQANERSEANSDALKQHGVYLISGGMGALGRLFAEFLARHYQARLVLLGRSPQGVDIEAQLDALCALGGEAIYVQAEVADLAQVKAAVRKARERFGQLDGVLHAAGIHRDAYLLKKSRADRAAVFATKILGALNLDLATSDDALDVFAMFASVAGAVGNAGQTDYAYANHFLDAFAHARNTRVALGCRRGRSVSVDWPQWAVDGMRPHDDVVAASESAGLLPLPPDAGLDAWMRILSGAEAQIMVLHGDAQRIAAALRTTIDTRDGTAAVQVASTIQAGAADLMKLAQMYLREKIGEEIRLDPARVDPNERFDAFGIDSMMVSRLNDRLMTDIGALPKTLFYEYSTVVELAGYLVREVPDALSNLLVFPTEARPEPVVSIREAARPVAIEEVRNPDNKSTSDDARETHVTRALADEPIAIVGLHGQYPRSEDLDALWEHLREGHDLIDIVPANRWDAEALYDSDPANAERGRIYCKWGAFLDDHDAFDAAFFRIGESEALSMDPQERLFLQSVWAALEDAGLTRDELRRRYPKGKSSDVGVFVGVTSNTYHLLGAERLQHELNSAHAGSELTDPTLSSLPWSIANRVSYVFDLQGPSLPVDTACSSSLVAIHLACESLRRAECRMAVAGGVNLYLHPAKYHGLCQRRMLAEHGRCRSYGAGDDGFVPGEGIGSLILKTLSQATRDGDRIHGLILASGYDHSGRSNGYSAPNSGAQVALIGEVLRRADIEASSIGYIEGHGTGTQLGDSLEVRALSQAFEATREQACVLGSIKANIGHTESAAGVLGVTKILLQMRHRQLAPSIHAEPVNPDIDFERTPFRMLKQVEAWEVGSSGRRRAMINAFGAGGVNACLVLEEYVAAEALLPAPVPKNELFVLSARSEERLRAYVEAWVERLHREGAGLELPEIARLLQIGREPMAERVALVAATPTELCGRLQSWLKGEASGVYCGGKGADCTDDVIFRQDDGMLKSLVQARDLHGIARAWAAGSDVPWRQLSSVASLPSGTLPTYPFARTRYWPSSAPTRVEADTSLAPALQLHPLISHNASNLWDTRYTSILSREAFYAQDHRVHCEPLLPGSAWLEIARAAGSLATMSEIRRLRDVVFVRPLAFVDPVQVTVTSLRIESGEVLFTIASHDPAQGLVVHCEGVLEYGMAHSVSEADWQVPIAALMRQSTHRIASEDCYARFKRSGIDYGPTFRTIQVMHAGDGFVLARLSLPTHGDDGEFGLHPSLIDGALQSISGFADGDTGADAFIPFGIDEIAIRGAVPMGCFAHAVESARSGSAREGIRKFDIDIANEEGVVMVSIKGLSVRSLKPRPSAAITHSSTSVS